MRVCTQFSYKKIVYILWTLLVFCTSGFSTQAFEPMNIPPLADFVVDHAGVLSSGDLQLLNQQWQQIQQQTSAQIATLLIPTQWDYQLVDIGLKIFRETWLGQKDKDNGVLLVINTEQKKIRIVVGYGLEWAVPDIAARDIIETHIRPLVNAWQYTQAIQSYYTNVLARIKDEGTSKVEWNQESNTSTTAILLVWIIRFMIFFIVLQYWNKKGFLYQRLKNKTLIKSFWSLYILVFGCWFISLLIVIKITPLLGFSTFFWWWLWQFLSSYLYGSRNTSRSWGWGSWGMDFGWMWWGGFSWWGWGFWWFSWWGGSSGWGGAGD